jgi:glycosyltransferase involved in cell wall biosynthesis
MIPAHDSAVSVVIPCFNAEATVADTIESALAQTWQDIEIIVIDDGSNDRSASLLRGFGNRIRADFGPNRGTSAARNRGTALATGAYIQYLDADDLLVPDAIERRVLTLHETGADVAYGDWQRFEVGADGSRQFGEVVARRMEDIDPDAEIACATAFWAPPAAILYRRRIVDAIGGWNERLPVIEDARFLFDAARLRARFVRVQGVSAFYRDASVSLSRGNERRFVLYVHRNAIEIQSLWKADGPLTEERKAALAGIFDMTARAFFRLGMPEFDDAVMRFKAVSRRRFGYPEVAHRVTRLAGRDVAVAAVAAGAHVARGLRSLLGGKR